MTENRVKIEPNEHMNEFNRNSSLMVTMSKDGKVNVMALDWKKIMEHNGKIVIRAQVAYSRYTYTLLTEGINQFTINIPSSKINHAVDVAGTYSGRNMDKIKKAGLETLSGETTKVPTLKDSLLSYECEIIHDEKSPMSSHHYFYGKILSCFALKELI